ncbi:MAG: 30S ribosome-binding factor RbfA [Gemmatimonadota bacterium]
MSGRRRIERLNGLLQEELSRLVRTELKDPRVGEITVTGVETTSDLMHAVVYVRTLGDLTPVEEAIEGLDSAEGYLRRLLGRELHLRRIPELRFVADRTLEHVQRIEALLDEARAEDGSEPAD